MTFNPTLLDHPIFDDPERRLHNLEANRWLCVDWPDKFECFYYWLSQCDSLDPDFS